VLVADHRNHVPEQLHAHGESALLVAVGHVVAHGDGHFGDPQASIGEVGDHVRLDVVPVGVEVQVLQRPRAQRPHPGLGVGDADVGAGVGDPVDDLLAEDAVPGDVLLLAQEAGPDGQVGLLLDDRLEDGRDVLAAVLSVPVQHDRRVEALPLRLPQAGEQSVGLPAVLG